MKIQNIYSTAGNPVANQFVITDGTRRVFQSYGSIICINDNGKITLDVNFWDYSKTTGKYRNLFLCETKKDTERKIKNGIYKLANLNG